MSLAQNSISQRKPLPPLIVFLFWTLFVAVLWSFNGYLQWVEYEFRNIAVPVLRLITNEASSALSVLILVFFVVEWLRRFPLTRHRIAKDLAAHAAGSVIFSLAHVGLMMLLRSLTYMFAGAHYVHAIPDRTFGLLTVFSYEYLKDLPVYIVFVAILLVYRIYLKGSFFSSEAQQVPATNLQSNAAVDKILVKSGKEDILLDIREIDWFQAASNYIQVFTQDREYLLRCSMTELEEKLSHTAFQRVHRGFIVNLSRVKKIVPTASGQHRLDLTTGGQIPVGRKYKDALYQRLHL